MHERHREIEPRKRRGQRRKTRKGGGGGEKKEKCIFSVTVSLVFLTWQITPFFRKFHQEPEEQTMPAFSSEILPSILHSFILWNWKERFIGLVFKLVAQKTEAWFTFSFWLHRFSKQRSVCFTMLHGLINPSSALAFQLNSAILGTPLSSINGLPSFKPH